MCAARSAGPTVAKRFALLPSLLAISRDWTPEAAEKGGFEHFMLKEIHEQPESLRQAIAGRVTRTDHIWLEELEGFDETLREIDRVELVACGTAYYAALVGAAAIQDLRGDAVLPLNLLREQHPEITAIAVVDPHA